MSSGPQDSGDLGSREPRADAPSVSSVETPWPGRLRRAGSLLPVASWRIVPRRLKVYRTFAGFHDAYGRCAIGRRPWAAGRAKGDLFIREAAEEVTDVALVEEPLAHPGELIRKPRGSFAEVVAPPSLAGSRQVGRHWTRRRRRSPIWRRRLQSNWPAYASARRRLLGSASTSSPSAGRAR